MKTTTLFLIMVLPLATFGQMIIDQDVPTKDITHNDDVIIIGSLNVGFDAVVNRNFGFDTQILSENNLRIYFEDTSNTASFPSNDWRIVINDTTNGGANYFAVQDATANKQVIRVDAGARNNAFYIDSQGEVGLGTSSPTEDVHAVRGDTPTIRLEQDASSGFTAQTWDMAGNETNFFVRDQTNNQLPFKIRPNAPTGSIVAESGMLNLNQNGANIDIRMEADTTDQALFIEGTSGYVGLGTDMPTSQLHVVGDMAKTGSLIGASDARIKTGVTSIVNAKRIINALDGKSFNYDRTSYGSLNLPAGTQYGLIAQEVEPVLKDLVKEDFMKVILSDGSEQTLMGVKYEQIIPILINAIKEQDQVIRSLNYKADSHEARIAKLESLLEPGIKSAEKEK